VTPPPPDVRVVRGEPDDVELAALVAGLAAGAAAHAHVPVERDSREVHARRRWREAGAPSRRPLEPGVDVWRWSAHP
jgi:hypothetical protein